MRHTRLRAVLLAAVIIVIAIGLGCGETRPPSPNLLLITLEDVRPDDLACYEPTAERGYALCNLAQEGGRFVWAFSPSPTTGPAAASLLTGQSTLQHGVTESAASFLPSSKTTLAEWLREGGYATAAFISNPELNRARNLHQGFDVYRDRLDMDAVVATTQNWMRHSQAPWFAWVHLSDSTPQRAPAQAPIPESTLLRLDREVAKLIAALGDGTSAAGILLTGLHGRPDPNSNTQPLALARLRVPLFWRAPSQSSGPGVGRRIRTPVSLIDVAPTLIAAGGLATKPTEFEGPPLPYADGPKRPDRTLMATQGESTLIIRGAEYAEYSEAKQTGPTAVSGRLWPASNPASEQTPGHDAGQSARDRSLRLQVWLPDRPSPDEL